MDIYDFKQSLGDSEGQGSLVRCSPWSCKESDMTERLSLSLSLLDSRTGKDTLEELVVVNIL